MIIWYWKNDVYDGDMIKWYLTHDDYGDMIIWYWTNDDYGENIWYWTKDDYGALIIWYYGGSLWYCGTLWSL